MSFLKITDPAKRDFLVQEYLKTKDNVRKNYITERTGELGVQRELSKYFKPVIESQKTVAKDLAKEITEPVTSVLRPISEGIQKAIELKKYQSIKAVEEEEEEDPNTSMLYIGEIASKYLRQFANKQEVDKTFGLYDKNGDFYIGDSQVKIEGDDITVKGKEYQGTPGLWELLIMKRPDPSLAKPADYANYAEILHETNAMKHNHDPKTKKPKSSKGYKYNAIIKPIWHDLYSGEGLRTTVIPSDPHALLNRLELLMASQKAGNTGVRNELVSICDELLRQDVIDKEMYKKIMLAI